MNNKDKKSLKQAINHCRVALATKQMFNLGDIERYLGATLPITRDRLTPLTIRDFNVDIAPKIESYTPVGIEAPPITIPSVIDEVKSVYEEHPLDREQWLGPPNPKQKAVLYPAQIKAAKDLAYKLFIEDRRGVLLRASVGVGKTFMYGQLVRWIYDSPTNFLGDCISPWPVLVVTKATIVEQTRRVMEKMFGLDTVRDVTVMHYDALRSSRGLETMLDIKKEVKNGEYFERFKWRPFLHPRVIILDESQAAKNEDSMQSKLVQALGDIPPEVPLKIVFSSATPFTRVIESKYFLINAGIPYRIV